MLFCRSAALFRLVRVAYCAAAGRPAFVAPNEEAGDKVKNSVNQEKKTGSDTLEMVKKIKAAKAPQSYCAKRAWSCMWATARIACARPQAILH
jgi:hypothetical protein